MLFALRNKKGQTIIEAIFIFNAMLIIFFFMLLISSFFYTRMIVIHAANAAINEAVGVAPQGLTGDEVQDRMQRKAFSVLQRTVFARPDSRGATAEVTFENVGRNVIANFRVITSAEYGLRIPLLSENLADELLRYELEIDYSWIVN